MKRKKVGVEAAYEGALDVREQLQRDADLLAGDPVERLEHEHEEARKLRAPEHPSFDQAINMQLHGARITELVRAAGMRLGCVVEHRDRAYIVYDIDLKKNVVGLCDVESGISMFSPFVFFRRRPAVGIEALCHRVLYVPPSEFQAPIIAIRREHDEAIGPYRKRTKHVLPRIRARLTDDEIHRHELYGEFWNVAAVQRILDEKPEKVPEKAKQTGKDILRLHLAKCINKAGFCMYCAFPLKSAREEQCPVCERRGSKLTTRFCILCGKPMTDIPKELRRWVRICDNHP